MTREGDGVGRDRALTRAGLGHGGAQGGAHVGLGELGAAVKTVGQGLDDPLGLGPVAGRAVDGDTAAGSLDQHLEAVLDQGDVPAVRSDDGAQGKVV